MKKVIILSLLFSLLLSATFFSLIPKVFAIGQITQPIEIKDVLRGQEVEETLILLNSDKKEVVYELLAEGEIADWAVFYGADDPQAPITRISIPAESNIRANVRFLIPEDAPNGIYRGQVVIKTIPQEQSLDGELSASVSLRVVRDVSIEITDKEIVQFSATFIPNYDVRKGEALKIRVIYENQGNVAVMPDLHLKITRAGEMIYNAIFPYPENEEAVRAKVRKEIEPILWQSAGQANGNYNAELIVLLDGETIEEESFRFSIGYSSFNFLAAIASIGGGNLTLAWLIIGAFFVLLAIVLTLLGRKPALLKAGLNRIKGLF